MARVLSFEIDGLAGRPATVRHALNSNVNVFWGPNGSGKTSMLRILHSALDNDATQLVTVPFEAARVTIYSADYDAVIIRSLDKDSLLVESSRAVEEEDLPWADQLQLVRVEASSRSRGWSTEILSQNRETPHISRHSSRPWPHLNLLHRYLPISRLSEHHRPAGSVIRAEQLNEAALDAVFAREVQSLWRAHNTEALTRIRAAQDTGLASLLGNVLSADDTTEVSAPLPADDAWRLLQTFFATRRRLQPRLGSLASWRERYTRSPVLQQAILELSTVQAEVDEAQEPQRRVELLLESLFASSKKVTFGREVEVLLKDERPIPLAALSSGEKQILRLLLECLRADVNSVLVDEPELSLHVDWQHQLVESMRSINDAAQLILATHSPEIMAPLSDEVVVEL